MSHASEVRYLRAGLEQLKDYLLSNEIFWNLGMDPQLTLGNLLLAEAHVKAGDPSAEDQKLIDELKAQKKEWRTAWEAKAKKEYTSRLRQWTQYLSELSENPSRFGAQYKTEARVRTLLELLANEAPDLGSELKQFDQSLKSFVTEGDFIWGSDSKAAFPIDKYWFLYSKPRGK
jgi:uncharacterized protein YukE